MSLLRPVQKKFPASSILYASGGARGPKFDLTCSKAGCDGASGELPARNSVRRAAEISMEPWLRRAGLPGPRLLRWRDEKNTAVMSLSQTRELFQGGKGLRVLMEIDAGARVVVE